MRKSRKSARIISCILAIGLLILLLSAGVFSAEDPSGGTMTGEAVQDYDPVSATEPVMEEEPADEEAVGEESMGEEPMEEEPADEEPSEDGSAEEPVGGEPLEEEPEEEQITGEEQIPEGSEEAEGTISSPEEEHLAEGSMDPEEEGLAGEDEAYEENGSIQEEKEPEKEKQTEEKQTKEKQTKEKLTEEDPVEEDSPSAAAEPEDKGKTPDQETPDEEADPGYEAGAQGETDSPIDPEALYTDPGLEETPENVPAPDNPVPGEEATEEELLPEEIELPAEEESALSAEDPYLLEGVDYSAFLGLDYSSGRLIVGTDDPSVFTDSSVIISSYRNLYMLQFVDIETTMRAYVYYLQKAEFVEIDGTSMAVNDGAYVTGEIMTEDDNPFSELKDAVTESGYHNRFDIALIDTGASVHTAGAVSMLGDDTWDDNGHGTEMASYIIDQNPDARILSIKAFGSNGLADMSAVYAAFQYALTQNVGIISISASAFASSDSELLRTAVYDALAAGVVVVASAGNNGRDARWYVPGGYEGVTTIGACDENGIRRAASNYGDAVEYYIVADTTSRAAAMFSGYLSRHGFEGVNEVLDQGLIYSPDYLYTDPAPDPDDPSDPDLPGSRPEVEGLEVEESKAFLVRYTFVDVNDYEEGMSISDFYQAGRNSLAQKSEYVTAYIDGEDYLFYADQPYRSGYADLDPVTWDFAEGNNEGNVITDGVWFDPAIKLARVHAGITGNGSEFADIQLQLMIPVSLSSHVHIPVAVSTNTDLISFTVGDSVEASPYLELTFPLMDETSAAFVRALEELEIYVNESRDALDVTEYLFNRETGELALLTRTGLDVTSLRIHVNLMDDETLLVNGYYNGTSSPVLADGRPDLTYGTGLYLKDFDTSRYSIGQTFTVTAKMQVGTSQVPAGGSTYAWYATNPNYFENASHGPVTPGYNATYVDNAVFIGLPKILDGQDFTFYRDAACTQPVGDYAAGYTGYNGAFFAYCHHVSSSLYNGTVNSSSGIVDVPFLIRIIAISTTVTGNTKIVFSIESTKAESITNYATYDAQTVGAVFAVETANQKGNVSFTKSASDTKGTLTVSKIAVSEEEPDKRFSFTLEYGPTVAYGTSSTFTLKGGESKNLSIPAGYCWRVTENDYSGDGWMTYYSTDNWATYQTGRSAAGYIPAQTFAQSYLFTVSGLTGTHTYTIRSASGAETGSGTIQNYGRIILRAGETATIMDIPAGNTVTASETYPLYTAARTVRKGDSGGDVWGLQWLLYEFGYLTVYPDGQFGSATESAVQKFQKAWNLYPDGEVGSITGGYLNALKSAQYGGNWSGGGAVSKTVVADKTVSLGTVTNTYTPDKQTLAFYNTQQVQTGDLTFAKKVQTGTGSLTVSKITDDDENISDLFEFSLTVNGRVGSGYSYTGSRTGTTDSHGRFYLKAGESITISGLPSGASYTVTETEIETDSGNPKYITYVANNERTISKGRSVSGTLASVPSGQAFTFQITGLPPGSYSYQIYNSPDASGTAVGSGTVSNNGKVTLKGGQSIRIRDIKAGTNVTVKETVPSSRTGTWKCDQTQNSASAVIAKNSIADLGTFTNTFTPGEQDVVIMNTSGIGYLYLIKTSGSEELCQGNRLYSLEGAVYEVYANRTHKVATLTTDVNGITEAVELPVGTYYIVEVQASSGHMTDPAMTYPSYATIKVETENTESNPAVIYSKEPVLGTSLSVIIRKIADPGTAAGPLAGAVFEIRYYDNQEGMVSETPLRRWRIQTLQNAAGEYTAQLDGASQENGATWLLEGSDALYIQDGEVMLPIGAYTVEEISPAAGYTLAGGYLYADQDPDNRVDTEGGKLSFLVEEEGSSIRLSTGNVFTAMNQTVRIDTEAWGSDLKGSAHNRWIDASIGTGIVTDEITFRNLTTGGQYRLTGQLYDRDSGDKIGEAVSMEFTAQTRDEDCVQMEFEVTGLDELAGHVLVVCEVLEEYQEGTWILMAEETDLTIEKQSVPIVRIRTSLKDQETGLHNSSRRGSVTLTDTVIYENLMPGREYVLNGTLIDKATGNAILDRTGTPVSSQLAFVPEAVNGEVQITFTLDDIPKEGITVVAFETLLLPGAEEEDGDREVAVHQDMDDLEQTLAIPGIHTSLTADDGAKTVSIPGPVVLYDTVEYTNLYPGTAYTLQGRLIEKETGDPLLDSSGREVVAAALFVPEEPEGRIALEFRFVAGEEYAPYIVAFEELYEGKVLIADHKDPEDAEQTVTVEQPPVPEEPTPETPTPEEPTPEAPTPEEPTPEAPTPEVPTPEVPTPEVPTPEVPTPEVPTPEVPTPEVPTPEVPTPEIPTPEIPTPEVPTPEGPTPEVPTPEVPTPEVPTPEVPTPEVPTPKAPTPEIPHTGDTNSSLLWMIAGGAAVLLLAAAVWILVRRRKQ